MMTAFASQMSLFVHTPHPIRQHRVGSAELSQTRRASPALHVKTQTTASRTRAGAVHAWKGNSRAKTGICCLHHNVRQHFARNDRKNRELKAGLVLFGIGHPLSAFLAYLRPYLHARLIHSRMVQHCTFELGDFATTATVQAKTSKPRTSRRPTKHKSDGADAACDAMWRSSLLPEEPYGWSPSYSSPTAVRCEIKPALGPPWPSYAHTTDPRLGLCGGVAAPALVPLSAGVVGPLAAGRWEQWSNGRPLPQVAVFAAPLGIVHPVVPSQPDSVSLSASGAIRADQAMRGPSPAVQTSRLLAASSHSRLPARSALPGWFNHLPWPTDSLVSSSCHDPSDIAASEQQRVARVAAETLSLLGPLSPDTYDAHIRLEEQLQFVAMLRLAARQGIVSPRAVEAMHADGGSYTAAKATWMALPAVRASIRANSSRARQEVRLYVASTPFAGTGGILSRRAVASGALGCLRRRLSSGLELDADTEDAALLLLGMTERMDFRGAATVQPRLRSGAIARAQTLSDIDLASQTTRHLGHHAFLAERAGTNSKSVRGSDAFAPATSRLGISLEPRPAFALWRAETRPPYPLGASSAVRRLCDPEAASLPPCPETAHQPSMASLRLHKRASYTGAALWAPPKPADDDPQLLPKGAPSQAPPSGMADRPPPPPRPPPAGGVPSSSYAVRQPGPLWPQSDPWFSRAAAGHSLQPGVGRPPESAAPPAWPCLHVAGDVYLSPVATAMQAASDAIVCHLQTAQLDLSGADAPGTGCAPIALPSAWQAKLSARGNLPILDASRRRLQQEEAVRSVTDLFANLTGRRSAVNAGFRTALAPAGTPAPGALGRAAAGRAAHRFDGADWGGRETTAGPSGCGPKRVGGVPGPAPSRRAAAASCGLGPARQGASRPQAAALAAATDRVPPAATEASSSGRSRGALGGATAAEAAAIADVLRPDPGWTPFGVRARPDAADSAPSLPGSAARTPSAPFRRGVPHCSRLPALPVAWPCVRVRVTFRGRGIGPPAVLPAPTGLFAAPSFPAQPAGGARLVAVVPEALWRYPGREWPPRAPETVPPEAMAAMGAIAPRGEAKERLAPSLFRGLPWAEHLPQLLSAGPVVRCLHCAKRVVSQMALGDPHAVETARAVPRWLLRLARVMLIRRRGVIPEGLLDWLTRVTASFELPLTWDWSGLAPDGSRGGGVEVLMEHSIAVLEATEQAKQAAVAAGVSFADGLSAADGTGQTVPVTAPAQTPAPPCASAAAATPAPTATASPTSASTAMDAQAITSAPLVTAAAPLEMQPVPAPAPAGVSVEPRLSAKQQRLKQRFERLSAESVRLATVVQGAIDHWNPARHITVLPVVVGERIRQWPRAVGSLWRDEQAARARATAGAGKRPIAEPLAAPAPPGNGPSTLSLPRSASTASSPHAASPIASSNPSPSPPSEESASPKSDLGASATALQPEAKRPALSAAEADLAGDAVAGIEATPAEATSAIRPARQPRARRKVRDKFLPEGTEHETAAMEMMLQGRSGPIRLGTSARDGRGVFAAGVFHKGDFVCEYRGVLLTGAETMTREEAYERRCWGSFIMTFQEDRHQHAIDATAERPEYGLARYINHSAKRANLRLCCIAIGGIPRVAMMAKTEIRQGQELLFDYGDREQSVLKHNPWLQQ